MHIRLYYYICFDLPTLLDTVYGNHGLFSAATLPVHTITIQKAQFGSFVAVSQFLS